MSKSHVHEIREGSRPFHGPLVLWCLALAAVAAGCSRSAYGPTVSELSDFPAEEDQAIVEMVHELYSSYSFENGEQGSLDQILQHFTPAAQLTFIRGDSAVTAPAREFFERRRRNLERNGVEFLKEWETFGETERFGRIAHRISAVAWQIDTTDSVTGRAVMSLQLVQNGDRWRVQSMAWHTVSEARPLPSRYDGR